MEERGSLFIGILVASFGALYGKSVNELPSDIHPKLKGTFWNMLTEGVVTCTFFTYNEDHGQAVSKQVKQLECKP